MEPLRAHVDLAIDLEHVRVPFGDLFRGPQVPGGLRYIHESAEEATLAAGGVVTEDGEVLPPVRALAGEADIDPLLAVHAQSVPTLHERQSGRCEVVKGNRSFDDPP